MPNRKSQLRSPLVQALAPRTVRGRLASATLSKPLIRECLVYLFRELLSKFPGSGLYVSRKPHLPRTIRLSKILYNIGRKSCQVFFQQSNYRIKGAEAYRRASEKEVLHPRSGFGRFYVDVGRCLGETLLIPATPRPMRRISSHHSCKVFRGLQKKILTFEGISSLIIPVSSGLAIFKVLFFIFCNLQNSSSKDRFE